MAMRYGFVVPWGDADAIGDLAADRRGVRLGRAVRVGAGVGRRCVDRRSAWPRAARPTSASARC